MKDFLLKNNEIMLFTDFNNTLVDFENEYNSIYYARDSIRLDMATANVKVSLSRALHEFERKTGLTPVICVVTNSSANLRDANNAPGIHQDLHMTFFNHIGQSAERAIMEYKSSCEKYFKYLMYVENECFYQINPLAESLDEMFVPQYFGEDALCIRYCPDFKKRESVERLMSVVDPAQKSKFVIFAGDSIKHDYPMKLMQSKEGLCKIFIRPGRVQKMKPSTKYEFCLAKGLEFTSVHPRTGKKIRCIDNDTIKLLSEKERQMLENFDDGDYILLTNKNSRGLIEGIYRSIDIINSAKDSALNQMLQ